MIEFGVCVALAYCSHVKEHRKNMVEFMSEFLHRKFLITSGL